MTKRSIRARFVLAALACLILTGSVAPAGAQSTAAPAATTPSAVPVIPPQTLAGKTIKVAMRVVPPFVFKKDEVLTGFSYELWGEIAKATGANAEITVIDTLPHLLESVKTKQADLAIAAISITAKREAEFDFSQPMFDSGLQVAVRADPSSNGSVLSTVRRMFTSGPVLNLLGALALLIIIPAHLVWFFERKHPSEMVSKKFI